jgi:hypothetical protein
MRIRTPGDREHVPTRTAVCPGARGKPQPYRASVMTVASAPILTVTMSQVDQILAMMVRSLGTQHVGLVQRAIENIT